MIRTAAVVLSLLTAVFAATASAAVPVPASSVSILQSTSDAFGGYEAKFAIDTGADHYLTDFAGAGTGAKTRIDFGFATPITFSNIVYTDRTSSGGNNGSNQLGTTDFVTQYMYEFSNDMNFATVLASDSFTVTTPVNPTSYLDFQHSNAFGDITAQFVRFSVLATNGPNPGAADFAFSAVPEPGSIALLGLGLFGFAMSRRKAAR